MDLSTSSASARSTAARSPHVPIRTCVGCRRKAEKPALLRVAANGGRVAVGAGVPGRGAYVCPSSRCREEALSNAAAPLARALRRRPGQIAAADEEIGAALAAVAHDDQRREGVST